MRFLRLLMLCLLPLVAHAATKIEIDGITVTGQPGLDHEVFHGLAEYRFKVINHSNKERLVDVRLSSATQNFSMNKTVMAAAGSSLEFSMFSNRRKAHHRLHVIVDNRKERSSSFREENAGYPQSKSTISLLLSKSMNQDDIKKCIEEMKGWTGNNRFNDNYTLRRTDLAANEWSANWLAYSSFDGIIIRALDYSVMSPGVQSALRQYVEAGGVLTIANVPEIPFTGAIVHELKSSTPSRKEYAVGFGRCFIYPAETPPASIWLMRETDFWQGTKNAFELNTRITKTNKKMDVVEQMTVPVRGFMLLITLFALLAGPATIFTLARMNRRIWLLWVIPLESAIACGIVLAYSFFSEGITPTVRMRGITLLNQELHSATTLGWLGYYCPQRPPDGLLFPQDLELNNVESFNWRHNPSRINWTHGQHLENGWVEARVPAFFMTRQSTLRRERLEFSTGEDGQVQVVNGLGAEIEQLWYCDADGKYFSATELQAGQKGALGSTESKFDAGTRLRWLFLNEYGDLDPFKREELPSYLSPGTYVAVLKGAPFMDHGLGKKKMHLKTESLVYGVLAREVQP